jgi:hydrogenase maturation protease
VKSRVTVLGYGNPGRGDDAAGPLLAEKAEQWEIPGVRVVSDYQLNVEHAADVAESELGLFIDAALDAADPWELRPVKPMNRNDFTTHAMLPETVMETCRSVYGSPPPAFVIAVRGENFELGVEPSAAFQQRIDSATKLLEEILRAENPAAVCEKHAAG